MKRLSILLDEELVNQVDMYAKKLNVSRTCAINLLLTSSLKVDEDVEEVLDEKLVKQVDDFVKDLKISRTRAVSLLLDCTVKSYEKVLEFERNLHLKYIDKAIRLQNDNK